MSSTTSSSPRVFRRADYKPLPIAVSSIRLNFLLGETTVVESTIQLTLAQNHTVQDLCDQGGLFLDGRGDVKLQNIRVGGKNLESGSDYVLSEHHLHLKPTDGLLHQFATATAENPLQIETTVHICPKNNSLLEGLYQSGGNYCTQCEAEGFRGITFFFDRPDILTRYTTRIEASKTLCPVLLSNGNLVEEGVLPSTNTEEPRHYVVWEDPFPKPSYLFALVAGQLVFREDTFRTCSGKDVRLRIYVQAQNIHRVDHAMNSLKRAMRWDEEKFGREYDLACFNIVAVDDFNMGAMENKSLNIFNSRAVLATSATATDAEFQRIEGIVAHEYFHNWTGNRVTCRDWFQLTLKEGLTVYRDQEFSSDMNCRDVYRLGVVSMVRSLQFPQDRGPMAHPIRPDVYEKIDNFYTITVYRKGAEIIRIYETILSRAGFRKGMDLYFERHDGQAVTCDNFRAAMEDANGVDLGVLGNWYSQAGTPQVKLRSVLNTDTKTYTLEVTQHTPSAAGEPEKRPVLIPIRMALLNAADGKPIPLRIHPSPRGLECPQVTPSTAPVTELVLPLSEMRQVFVFDGVDADACVLSAMRGFSAPVEYSIEGESPETWRFLLEKDTDGFVRYESSQRLAMHSIVQIYQHFCTRRSCNQVDMAHDVTTFEIDNPMVCELLAAYRSILTDRSTNLHLVAHLLSFPSNAELMAQIPRCQPPILYAAKNALRRTLSKALSKEYQALLAELEASSPPLEQAYVYNSEHVARRALLNTVLSHLAMSPTAAEEMYPKLLERQRNATNMTDELGAVQILNQCCDPAPRKKSLDDFYKKWSVDPLVLLNWMSLHAVAEVSHNISTIQSIMASPDFHIKNPNCCYALISAFASSLVNFHAADGSGYAFMADCVLEIDTVNHQVAAKTVACFNIHKQLDEAREHMILTQLKRLAGIPGLSANVREVISKSIQSAAEIKSA